MEISEGTILDLVKNGERMATSLEGVEKHLGSLNSKVANHEARFNTVEKVMSETQKYVEGQIAEKNESSKTKKGVVVNILEKLLYAIISTGSILAYRVFSHANNPVTDALTK